MKIVRTIAGWLTPIVILAAGFAVFRYLGSQPPPERKQADKPAAAPVRAVEVIRETGGLTIELDGVVVPLREVTLAAEVPGRVLHKSEACKAGRFVTAGTPLFEIDPRDYEFDVARLEREASQAALAIEEAEEEIKQNATAVQLATQQLELAGREVKRLDGLKAGRIVTEAEHDRAIREELSAITTLTNLQGQARVLVKRKHRLEEAKALAETMLDRSKLDLARTKVAAPTDGVIVEDHVEQDSYVAKGMALVTIEDTRQAEVRTSLQMDELARVWRSAGLADPLAGGAHEMPDTPVTVVFTVGDSQYEWDGFLSRQEGRGLDEKTRTLPCRVIVTEPTKVRALDRYGAAVETPPPGSPRSLMRGMFVQVRFHVDSPHELVSIPEEARRPSGEVWLVRDGRLEILRPKPVQVAGGRAIFESGPAGLVAGDRVVTSQLTSPRPGMAVVEPASRSAAAPAAAAAPAVTPGRDDT
ncbi:MAG: efflux RND transporter periplasmic adaptor subunit [Planctomycetota bacterium]